MDITVAADFCYWQDFPQIRITSQFRIFVMDKKMHQDLTKLLSAARTAINVMRYNAEQLETIGQDSTTEREAVRRLNMAVQMVEYRIAQSREGTGTLEA